MAQNYTYSPIGIIHSPFHDPAGMPIQPAGASGVRGSIEIYEDYKEGVIDLDGFSRIFLIYPFHRLDGYALSVTPFLDTTPHGVFATRAPRRPNALGLSSVRLCEVRGCVLNIEDVDILDGTPLFDIKPYVPAFDAFPNEADGWLSGRSETVLFTKSDSRFMGNIS
ncbi:MAG: tRNA (N6-threonylcarbamoyladenosine(37)-N6)-methyltransferase TrmO [Methanomicrobiales archaeon]|nr:tRNA (N6-threonylcarbamoyladenosine(37)-N6)-methyltransferase TrmO [Methanomicrobiales archaeon]